MPPRCTDTNRHTTDTNRQAQHRYAHTIHQLRTHPRPSHGRHTPRTLHMTLQLVNPHVTCSLFLPPSLTPVLKLAMANPDAHDVWKNPEMWSRNQELTYASYPRHPDYAGAHYVDRVVATAPCYSHAHIAPTLMHSLLHLIHTHTCTHARLLPQTRSACCRR